jgi:L-threonylcarbamoyladenylate synthase
MNTLETAKKALENGGIVIFPTETVYGIGCLLKFPKSIEKLYKIKKRDVSKPTSVLVKDLAAAEKLVIFNQTAYKLAAKFWPGPLTICLPAIENVPKSILGTDNTLSVRVPSNQWLLELLTSLNEPLLAPSANFQGSLPPKKRGEIDKELIKLVDYVVDIEPDSLEPSTVVSLSNEREYKLIREGSIKKASLDQVLSTSSV